MTLAATFPKRTIAWGSPTGWPDRPQCEGARHFSWTINDGRPEAGPKDQPASLSRHPGLANREPVHLVIISARGPPVLEPAAVHELAYLVMGTGIAAGFAHNSPVWYDAAGRAHELRVTDSDCGEPSVDPMRPLAHCCWQRPSGLRQVAVSREAVDADSLRSTIAAAAELWGMARGGTDVGDDRQDCVHIPDGVVPTALVKFLSGVGCLTGELTETTGRIIAAQCDAVHWAELARARQTAGFLAALGVLLPASDGSDEQEHAVCTACGTAATRFVHVTADRWDSAAELIGAVAEKHEAALRARLHDSQLAAAVSGLRRDLQDRGVVTCVACAAKTIIECRVRARPVDPNARASRSAAAGTEATARVEWLAFQREVLASPDALEAAPGLAWQTPAAAARHKPHHGGEHAVAHIGTMVRGTTWCIEDIAPAPSPPHEMGVWAYDTARWPSAAERLDERCVFLGTPLWQQLRQEAQQAARAATRPTARLAACGRAGTVSCRARQHNPATTLRKRQRDPSSTGSRSALRARRGRRGRALFA